MQTTYDLDYPVGVEGQKVDAYPSGIITVLSEGGPLNVGKLVVMDATAGRNDKAARHPAATGDVTGPSVLGIVMWDPTFPEPPYPRYKAIPAIRKGRIFMACETVIAKGVRPFVRFEAGAGGTVLGSIRNDADTATAVVAPYLVTITPATSIGGLCVVEINL